MMASVGSEPVLIVSPRYADEVAASVAEIEMLPRIERRPERALERFEAEPVQVVVVDARGALPQGLAAARALGTAVEMRKGAMLVLLSRGDGLSTEAAHDAGATGVLVSPFGSAAFGNALRLAARHTQRLADATALLEQGEEARARHDLLTGLATGDQLQNWVSTALADRAAENSVFVLVVGVGRFAQINAAYGRAVADRVLSVVATRLSRIVDGGTLIAGETRLLARLAAAEFAVALAGPAGIDVAVSLANALAQAFENPFRVDDHVIHLSARVGIAGSDDSDSDGGDGVAGPAEDEAAALIRRASSALVTARSGEAGTVEVFEIDPEGDPLTRLADLEADLHNAIENGDIAVLFQPQLSLATGLVTGVEALVRWDHPELGLLPAETLLGTAASAELAIKLGRHIRSRAMARAARWTGAMARLRLSLNVTAADLADPGFAEAIAVALLDSGLSQHRLTLEVTEGALIDDIYSAVELLGELRSGGVKVALDDFGTGYSSLAWMARLPIDAIKLDRSFTLGLTGTPRERVVVETMVRLSKQLALTVIAEGVEDDIQLEATRLAGCDAVQGYRVAAPMTEAALQAFCETWQLQALGG